ncbi:hypothetical protein EVAR_97843_1 [Eumeta japonica]|uniref:Uncharacterized protein n=1 Tax=Eumeta variegata TaxID=151549 RepID=A0A4C1X022_EUMVA|nr:hypothetical protein EVAR_97843_1 [Eumeta japonica]
MLPHAGKHNSVGNNPLNSNHIQGRVEYLVRACSVSLLSVIWNLICERPAHALGRSARRDWSDDLVVIEEVLWRDCRLLSLSCVANLMYKNECPCLCKESPSRGTQRSKYLRYDHSCPGQGLTFAKFRRPPAAPTPHGPIRTTFSPPRPPPPPFARLATLKSRLLINLSVHIRPTSFDERPSQYREPIEYATPQTAEHLPLLRLQWRGSIRF